MKVDFKPCEKTGWLEDYIRIEDFAERAIYVEHGKLLELIERLMAVAALYKYPRLNPKDPKYMFSDRCRWDEHDRCEWLHCRCSCHTESHGKPPTENA